MSSHRHAPGTAAWRSQQAASGGGVLIDSAIHLIDVVHWCMGVEEEVTAAQRALAGGDIKAGGDIEVDGGVLLRYADGRLAMIGATQAGAAGAGVYYRLELVGTARGGREPGHRAGGLPRGPDRGAGPAAPVPGRQTRARGYGTVKRWKKSSPSEPS